MPVVLAFAYNWSSWVNFNMFKWLGCRCSLSYLSYGMICCSQRGLTEALYILCIYIYVFFTLICTYQTFDNRLTKTMTNDRPIHPSEGAPYFDKHVTVKHIYYLVMSPRWGLTPRRTDRLTVGRNGTLTLTSLITGTCQSGSKTSPIESSLVMRS
jgi:hypothetical protein